MKTRLCQLALILAAASLAGCGLKGPLYFPKEQPAISSDTPTAATSGSDAQVPATSTGQSATAAQ